MISRGFAARSWERPGSSDTPKTASFIRTRPFPRRGSSGLSSPWFFGPFGWALDEIRPLAEPVPCKGALGLWRVPEHIEHLMRFAS